MAAVENEFGRLRAFVWPIHRHELSRFVPMLLIFFLICFNYNILRAAKDSLVVTAPFSGAEAIPFIKVWAILPSALLMTFLYTRFSNHLKREHVFYAMISLFLVFFILFAFFLYPYRESLHPHALANRLEQEWPLGCRGFIAMFRNWTCTTYYIMSEMWSTIIMTVLFWGFANEVTSIREAKRFYAVLGIGANVAGILSGWAATTLSRLSFHVFLPFGTDAWEQSVAIMSAIVIINCVLCILLFRFLHIKGYAASTTFHSSSQPSAEKSFRMGLRESFSYLAKSRYLICIALIVVMYNLALNLVEVVWKDQVKQLHPNPSDFNAYMGQVLTAVGVVATLIAMFASANILRKFPWTFGALITPIIVAAASILFFSFTLFKDTELGILASFLGTTPLLLSVFFGAMQNCLARASKYTLFDATKEMAFIPLSRESKLKGKAAIDGVGSRLGKSGGSIIHQGLLMFLGTVSMSTPYVALILLAVIAIWVIAVRTLGKEFTELTVRHEKLHVDEPQVTTATLQQLPQSSN
ncbi:MAG: NTP/NDP exchange transporter [Anaplasmataceae bacterium]|nr:NTP/NDP exchange transporter [Anaplasmataceae bacterium]